MLPDWGTSRIFIARQSFNLSAKSMPALDYDRLCRAQKDQFAPDFLVQLFGDVNAGTGPRPSGFQSQPVSLRMRVRPRLKAVEAIDAGGVPGSPKWEHTCFKLWHCEAAMVIEIVAGRFHCSQGRGLSPWISANFIFMSRVYTTTQASQGLNVCIVPRGRQVWHV